MDAQITPHLLCSLFDQKYNYFVIKAQILVRDKELAKDMVSDVFLKLLQKKEQLKMPENLIGYMLMAIHNRCIYYLRQESVRNKHLKPYYRLSNTFREIAYDHQRDYDHVKAVQLIVNLPPRGKTVVQLHYMQGKTCHEIAEIMHISHNTVKKHLERALRVLRRGFDLHIHGADIPLNI